MRLLNIKTLKLEWFHNADVAPSYAILSHRWEDEEVLFEDVEEKPEAQKLRSLQRKLEETERRLDALSRKIEGKSQTDALFDLLSVGPGSANTESSVQRSPDTVKSATVTHVHESQAAKPKGWAKVLAFCKIAEQFGISYVWIDTCCIDKNSSTELSESLNSMFAWYRCATLCIAYLSDADTNWWDDDSYRLLPPHLPSGKLRHPRSSDWFTRGWTLQELIAPKDVWFYKRNWTLLGIRSELVDELHKTTGVQKEILQKDGLEHLHTLSVAARMSWAANRKTTRPEDLAYSLLGLFGVNMPILYGEGEQNAFFRLQVMIFQSFSDHSIFAWKALSLPPVSWL
ncbi:heterokaryon incompatibility protein-domain-containing protein [Hyaloscypha finlandica]|nr:heterokaryon incompatibility protein-domain-containing protein [Hyaloscypha finlandica]